MIAAKKKSEFNLETCLEGKVSSEWLIVLKNLTSNQKFKKNDRIIEEGTSVKGFYFIISGKVKIVTSIYEGQERILRLSHAGNLMGHRAISANAYPVSAIALTDVEVTFIPTEVFLKMIGQNPNFAIFLVEFIARDLRETEERMKSMIHNDVIVRIALILCLLIDSYGYNEEIKGCLQFTLPRSDMANMAGTSYESVIRTLSKLEDMKLIRLEKKNIIILKESGLRKLSKEKSRL